MRAAAIHAFGGPDKLRLIDLPLPVPGPGQVRVRVSAAAVNPIDLGTREGRVIPEAQASFPMVLGWDVAGVVDALGEGVTQWREGDAVIALCKQPVTGVGTYAEFLVLNATLFAPQPEGVEPSVAATLPLAGVTAYQALKSLELAPGQSLLVDNPVGAVGGFAVQLAKHWGVQVIAPVSKEYEVVARDLGVDEVLDITGDVVAQAREAAPGGVDAAFDVLGGASAQAAFASVRDGGRYTTTLPEWWAPGGPFTPSRGIDPQVIENEPSGPDLDELSRLMQRGVLRGRVGRTLELTQAAEAHRLTTAPGLQGKIVLAP